MKRIALLLLLAIPLTACSNTAGSIAGGANPIGTLKSPDVVPPAEFGAPETPPVAVAKEGGPDLKVGDWFEYRRTDGKVQGLWSGKWTLREIRPDSYVWDLSRGGMAITDLSLNLKEWVADGVREIIAPIMPMFRFPIAPMSWRDRYTYTNYASNISGNGISDVTITGPEKVSVAGGNFEAWRTHIQMVDSKNWGWKSIVTFWYAPKVRYWIKCESNVNYPDWDFEMVAYGRTGAAATRE